MQNIVMHVRIDNLELHASFIDLIRILVINSCNLIRLNLLPNKAVYN